MSTFIPHGVIWLLVDFFYFTSDCFLVNALEYTKFMLVAMKKIDWELSDNLQFRIKQLDKTENGKITKVDLIVVWQFVLFCDYDCNGKDVTSTFTHYCKYTCTYDSWWKYFWQKCRMKVWVPYPVTPFPRGLQVTTPHLTSRYKVSPLEFEQG